MSRADGARRLGDDPAAGSDDGGRVAAAVDDALASRVPRGATIVIALSGGRDSVALLDATLASAAAYELDVAAVHIHHALSVHADAWARFCAELCAARGVRLMERRVEVPRARRVSVEAAARRVRYEALAQAASAANARALLLAHHQDDQAETVLLQLLRGAGPHGLAAMPRERADPAGFTWLRPLLDVPRAAIDAYVRGRRLVWIDDDTNDDARFARNALRAEVVPALASLAAGYPATVARAALHQAEAVRIADDMALVDAGDAFDGTTLSRSALGRLPPHRARNLIRWFLRERGLPAPSAARLKAMAGQLCSARVDARVCLSHAGVEIGIHRDRVVVHRPPPAPFERIWHGEPEINLPHGTLRFVASVDGGIDPERLATAPVIVRSRTGGERIALGGGRPRRALKLMLQDAGIPAWERAALPLVFCGDALAAVPGLGVDVAFRAATGQAGLSLAWLPNALSRGEDLEARPG